MDVKRRRSEESGALSFSGRSFHRAPQQHKICMCEISQSLCFHFAIHLGHCFNLRCCHLFHEPASSSPMDPSDAFPCTSLIVRARP